MTRAADMAGIIPEGKLVETGSIIAMTTSTVPAGYLECDGSSLSTTTYADLFAVLDYDYGGSGANFSIPDYRGEFLRGWANTDATDPDRASRTNRGDGTTGDNVGTKQASELKSHLHAGGFSAQVLASGGGSYYAGLVSANTTNYSGSSETRPTNVNVMYCIKY